MAKARQIPGLGPDTRFADAAAAAVEVRSAEVFEHSAGVLDSDDIERVHAMRVSTRRLRAALEVFAVCFERKEHRRVLREVKALADALGERRDPDVALEALAGVAAELTRADRSGIASLAAELREEQKRGNAHLEQALARTRESHLEERLAALARAARSAEAEAGAARAPATEAGAAP
ncbi:MAG: CHAD domain-containing protein [Thermoleophilaceae bacterium]